VATYQSLLNEILAKEMQKTTYQTCASCPDVAALIGVDWFQFFAEKPLYYLRSTGAIWTWKISPNAFDTHALKRSFKHTRMPVYRASVRRALGSSCQRAEDS
jgi:hypothetical protein